MACQCGAGNVVDSPQTFKNGTEHIRRECGGCGRFIEWADQKIPDESFVMPYGKHKGETFAQIKTDDINYCKWGAENIEGDLGERFKRIINS